MVKITRGNLLKAEAQAVVNTVNCDGYMGKGIALQFKQAFPANFEAYRVACNHKEIKPGRMFVFETDSMINPKLIINFPTKRHWREKSHIEDIDSGLKSLVEEIKARHITSIAIPPLGCGLGGLSWNVVRPKIENAFKSLSDVEVILFEPAGTPEAKTMPIGTKRPHLTFARALLLKLMEQYSVLSYSLTLLEIQKLAYFMQESGEALRLKYKAGHYGPYAENLNKVLQVLEGHFTRGCGSSARPDQEVEIIDGSLNEADDFLASHKDHHQARLEKVASLIEGFESPYGMELLSSVHWLATHATPTASNGHEAAYQLKAWNERKAKMFNEKHVHIAWKRLEDQGWLATKKFTH